MPFSPRCWTWQNGNFLQKLFLSFFNNRFKKFQSFIAISLNAKLQPDSLKFL